VYVKDTHTGTLTKASPDSGTVPQVTGFFGGALSDDGTKVLFITRPAAALSGRVPLDQRDSRASHAA
jgi:hypothetical protein